MDRKITNIYNVVYLLAGSKALVFDKRRRRLKDELSIFTFCLHSVAEIHFCDLVSALFSFFVRSIFYDVTRTKTPDVWEFFTSDSVLTTAGEPPVE